MRSQGRRLANLDWDTQSWGPGVALGVSLMIGGSVVGWLASRRQGADYASLQLMGRGIALGSPIYDLAWQKAEFSRLFDGIGPPLGMFYPPATGFTMLPFALLPVRIGQLLWYALMTLAVVCGVRALVRTAAPTAGRHIWMITAGLVLISSALRWGMTPLQGAPLVLGLLCFLIVSLHADRPYLAFAIAAFATAFKITLALPFLGLLFLYRRHSAWVAALVVWVMLNAAGFARLGGLSALAAIDRMSLERRLSTSSIPGSLARHWRVQTRLDLAIARARVWPPSGTTGYLRVVGGCGALAIAPILAYPPSAFALKCGRLSAADRLLELGEACITTTMTSAWSSLLLCFCSSVTAKRDIPCLRSGSRSP